MAHSYTRIKPALLARLARIEGQMRGLQKMVEEDKYCIDIVTQLNAARRALDGVGLVLIEEHTKGCVRDALSAGRDEGDEKVEELTTTLSRFIKG
jgi:DNA-binding FrmR family transcriptional regulator